MAVFTAISSVVAFVKNKHVQNKVFQAKYTKSGVV